jgi:hypothetical protein
VLLHSQERKTIGFNIGRERDGIVLLPDVENLKKEGALNSI